MSNGFPATIPWAALSCGQSAVLAAAPKHRRESGTQECVPRRKLGDRAVRSYVRR